MQPPLLELLFHPACGHQAAQEFRTHYLELADSLVLHELGDFLAGDSDGLAGSLDDGRVVGDLGQLHGELVIAPLGVPQEYDHQYYSEISGRGK